MFKNFIVKFPSTLDVYALINGELAACKVLSVTADADKQKSFVVCESPDGFKNSFKVDELYSSVKAYEDGKTVITIKPEFRAILPGCIEIAGGDETGDLYNLFYWAMVDGEPQKVNVDVKHVEFNPSTRTVSGGIKLPDEFYGTREECIKWNDINIVEADGSKRVQRSVLRSLIINDEQRAIIDELKAVFEKAKDAGIIIGYNSDWMEWIAINKTNYPKLRFDWSDSISEEESNDAIWISDRKIHSRFRADLPAPAYVTECDRVIIANPAD